MLKPHQASRHGSYSRHIVIQNSPLFRSPILLYFPLQRYPLLFVLYLKSFILLHTLHHDQIYYSKTRT